MMECSTVLIEFGITRRTPLSTLIEGYIYDFYLSFCVNFTLRTVNKHLTLAHDRHSVFPAEVNGCLPFLLKGIKEKKMN